MKTLEKPLAINYPRRTEIAGIESIIKQKFSRLMQVYNFLACQIEVANVAAKSKRAINHSYLASVSRPLPQEERYGLKLTPNSQDSMREARSLCFCSIVSSVRRITG